MTEAVWVALIVSLLAPTLMVWQQNRNAVAKEKRDNARQDAVAATAAEAARLLLENQRQVADQAAATNKEIKILTGMLDGNFTQLMEDNLTAISHALVLSRQVVALTFAAGHEPDPESLAEIKATEDRIAELAGAIAKRKHSDAVMKLQSAQPTGPVPVTDDRTAAAAERSATAIERIATATEDKNGT